MTKMQEERRQIILDGKTSLGIELGSSRIKAVLIDYSFEVIASGEYGWENQLSDGIWTYSLEEVWTGLATSYKKLKQEVKRKYDLTINKIGSIGVSAMMHGYLAFDENNEIMVPFRTWRNTLAASAADELTELLKYNIPLRWSISHLYHAIMNKEAHVPDVSYLTTLSGYVHWILTGSKVLGIGDASGMFPVDYDLKTYNSRMVRSFDDHIESYKLPYKILDILPEVLSAGEEAGRLTAAGAKLIDPEGDLPAGIPLCPPEGDAGTGMVATNSIAAKTANVSAGTSIFAMLVLEHDLSKVHQEIDMVATPSGNPVAMVHGNNCSSDIDAWVSVFREFAEILGVNIDRGEIFQKLYTKSLEGDEDAGSLLAYNFYAGEPIADVEDGRLLFIRKPDSKFNLANFMKMNIYSAFGVLKLGLDILYEEEKIKIDSVLAHGGIFKTEGVAQRYLAAAMETSVSVMKTAGEGGAWGIAILASYLTNNDGRETLEEFLENRVFKASESTRMEPDAADIEGFKKFMDLYKAGLPVERVAIEAIK